MLESNYVQITMFLRKDYCKVPYHESIVTLMAELKDKLQGIPVNSSHRLFKFVSLAMLLSATN